VPASNGSEKKGRGGSNNLSMASDLQYNRFLRWQKWDWRAYSGSAVRRGLFPEIRNLEKIPDDAALMTTNPRPRSLFLQKKRTAFFRQTTARYAVALLITAAALALRELLNPVLGDLGSIPFDLCRGDVCIGLRGSGTGGPDSSFGIGRQHPFFPLARPL